jgi:ABC-type sulfate/molybdate transport systems ATPase subunit
MVTHNPELTRFASRVLFMHDGEIVGDEKTAFGEIPEGARRSMYFLPRKTEEDDFAGVSALMQAIPEEEEKQSGRKKTTKAKTKTYRARSKKTRGKKS